ncbi:MAG TPA: PEP-CTERM sorting domain-containing protein [Terriglobia bacterium]|nr:PEP-CTERM sorting domain-containing protein [Terriglobia bacterium]
MEGSSVALLRRAATRKMLFLSCVLALVSTTAFAGEIPFSGSGTSGTAAPGVTFSYDFFGASPEGNWGIPGVGASVVSWPGSTTISGFDITFALPAGTAIDPAQIAIGNGAGCAGFIFGGTTFCASPYSAPWTAVLVASNTIDFSASPGNTLVPGDDFFVNIFFSGPDPSGASFSGNWITSLAPEPGTMFLFGIGFLGLAAVLHRRQLG